MNIEERVRNLEENQIKILNLIERTAGETAKLAKILLDMANILGGKPIFKHENQTPTVESK